MTVYAIIPARGGSRRLAVKNLEKIKGRTLVARAIDTARACKDVDKIIVSTDSWEIASEARSDGVKVIDRPSQLAQDDTKMDDVIAHVVEVLGCNNWKDYLVILEPTAPLRIPDDLAAVIASMCDSDTSGLQDHLMNVPAIRFVYPVRSSDGCHVATYRDAGLANIVRGNTVSKYGCLFPPGTVMIDYGESRSIDVDTPADLERARAMASDYVPPERVPIIGEVFKNGLHV